jgi:hypothetical protein
MIPTSDELWAWAIYLVPVIVLAGIGLNLALGGWFTAFLGSAALVGYTYFLQFHLADSQDQIARLRAQISDMVEDKAKMLAAYRSMVGGVPGSNKEDNK